MYNLLIILTSLTLMTWNTHQLGQGKKLPGNEVIQYLQNQDADVVCLEEVEVRKDGRGVSLTELRGAMKKYKYTYYDFKIYNERRQYGNVVFSRYPLINKRTLRYESRGNISSSCDVCVGTDTIRLMVNYLESNRISLAERNDSLTTKSLMAMGKKLMEGEKIRSKQVEVIREAIGESPYPVIVVGDMNSLPFSGTISTLGEGLTDCYSEVNWLNLGGTFCLHGVWIRIDYIFADEKMKVKESKVDYDAKGSDHQPVYTELKL